MKKYLILGVALIVSVFLIVASWCYNSTAEGFYRRMTKLEPCEQWVFRKFPKQLEKANESVSGDIIISTENDTLSLVCKFPNQADMENRYPFYVLKDNHHNVWTIFQEQDKKFHMYREDVEKLEILQAIESSN